MTFDERSARRYDLSVKRKENRRHPRVQADFPVRMGPLASVVVRDLSLSGVRCLSRYPITPMTMVGLRLEVPTGEDGPEAVSEITCQGVVVRCRVLEEGDEPRYETAILFQDLPPPDRERMSRYISSRLESTPD